MAVITAAFAPGSDLEQSRSHTRELAYGEIVGAVFPIEVGPGPDDKAWYQVVSLRPLQVEWLPYTNFQVSPEALSGLSKNSIYRLIEADIRRDASFS